MLKKLQQTKFILIILQGISIVLLVFCYMFIKSNMYYIKNSENYLAKEITIDSFYPFGGNSQKSKSYRVIGIINNKNIHINIGYSRDNKNISKKDTLLIWYNTLNGTGKKR